MIDRNIIISALKENLIDLPYINALWLEGSDANNTVDEYSDIDIWIDFNDEFESETFAAVEKILSDISPIDYKYVTDHSHPKIRQNVYHLENTSEYLMIDLCLQLHSRTEIENIQFLNDDKIESPLVIFDKLNIIMFREYDKSDDKNYHQSLIDECIYRYTQHSRVYKYYHRKQYLECYIYYNKYVLEPLILLLRILYTPAHTEYYMVHISHHIPKEMYDKLEYFTIIPTFCDIYKKITEAREWYDELLSYLDK